MTAFTLGGAIGLLAVAAAVLVALATSYLIRE